MRLTTPRRLVSSTCGEDLIAYLGADWQRWPKAFLDRIVLPDLRGAGGWRGDCHSRPRDLGFCQDRRSLVVQWRGTSDTAEHRRHCRHDDWPETLWTALIHRLAQVKPMLARCDPLSHTLEFLILLRVGGQFAGVQADSNFSSLSGSVPFRAGQPVRGNHMPRPRWSLSVAGPMVRRRVKQTIGSSAVEPTSLILGQ